MKGRWMKNRAFLFVCFLLCFHEDKKYVAGENGKDRETGREKMRARLKAAGIHCLASFGGDVFHGVEL